MLGGRVLPPSLLLFLSLAAPPAAADVVDVSGSGYEQPLPLALNKKTIRDTEDGEHGLIRLCRSQNRGGSDHIAAALCTASPITQPTPTVTLASTSRHSSSTPIPPPQLHIRQQGNDDEDGDEPIPSRGPQATIFSLSSTLLALSQASSLTVSSLSVSANSAIQSAQSSAASSAAFSVSMALSSAWESVSSASREVESAKIAVATVRAEAEDRVQEAQGAVVSVTQAALGIVGGIIASSILSVLAVYCVMRWKRTKKKQQQRLTLTLNRKNSIGYPSSGMTGPDPMAPSTFDTSTIRRPAPTPRRLQRRMTTGSAPASSRGPPNTSPIPEVPIVPIPPNTNGNNNSNNNSNNNNNNSNINGDNNTTENGNTSGATNDPKAPFNKGFPSPRATAVGYATSSYGYGGWQSAGTISTFPHSDTAPLIPRNLTTTPPSRNPPNFSRRHTRAESAPVHPWGHARTDSVPSTAATSVTYVPTHTHSRSASSGTLGGVGVGGDLRSPLRRNVVSMYPQPRDGGGLLLVRPEDSISSNGGAKDAPLPPPPLGAFERSERLSRVTEEGGARNSGWGLRPLDVRGDGKISPFEWGWDAEAQREKGLRGEPF